MLPPPVPCLPAPSKPSNLLQTTFFSLPFTLCCCSATCKPQCQSPCIKSKQGKHETAHQYHCCQFCCQPNPAPHSQSRPARTIAREACRAAADIGRCCQALNEIMAHELKASSGKTVPQFFSCKTGKTKVTTKHNIPGSFNHSCCSQTAFPWQACHPEGREHQHLHAQQHTNAHDQRIHMCRPAGKPAAAQKSMAHLHDKCCCCSQTAFPWQACHPEGREHQHLHAQQHTNAHDWPTSPRNTCASQLPGQTAARKHVSPSF